jgi:hypothetical protein
MNCVEVEKYLGNLLDHSLDRERVRQINDHLTACSRCSEELAALAECQRLVSGLPPVEPPAGFTSRVMAEVREAAHRPTLWQRLSLSLQTKLPLQATAVVLITVLAAYIYQKDSRQREPATTAQLATPFRSPNETDKLPPSAAQAPAVESKRQNSDEAGAPERRLKSSAPPEQPRSLPEPEEQSKIIDGVQPGAPAAGLSNEPGRSLASSPLEKQSSGASEAASPRLEQALPSTEAHAPPASAAVPQFDKGGSFKDAAPAANHSSPSALREKRATSLDAVKSGRTIAALPADHELTLRLKEPARDNETAAAPLELERPQAQPRPSPARAEFKDLDQARQRVIKTGQPQTVWATIAGSEYDGFKRELAGLGSIESELPAPAHKNDAVSKSSYQLRIKVTILPPLSSAEPPSNR